MTHSQLILSRVNALLLAYHLETCVAEAMKKGERDTVVKKMVEVFKKSRI